MWLSELTVHHCRILEKCSLEFSPEVNFIYGDNGSGKTSLLEALSILSLGRSFRTSRVSDVIQYGKESLIVSSNSHSDHYSDQRIGIEKSAHKTLIRVNKQTIKSQSQLSKMIPVSIIHPLSHQLITGSSSLRRNFLDWIAFYQFPEFHPLWKRYQIILKQRNAALKSKNLSYAINHLTSELCKLQQPIHSFRVQALSNLEETINNSIPSFLLEYKPEIVIDSGIPSGIPLDADELSKYYLSRLKHESIRGRTLKGIHRADLKISFKSKTASTSASRGETKIISLLLHIAQNLTITEHGLIAIDDLSAEIDSKNLDKVMDYILQLGRQLFITSTERPNTSTLSKDFSMFHVEQGVVKT